MMFGAQVIETRYYYSRNGDLSGEMQIASYAGRMFCGGNIAFIIFGIWVVDRFGSGILNDWDEVENYAYQVFGDWIYIRANFMDLQPHLN